MSGMDMKQLQATANALDAEIARLTVARDSLRILGAGKKPTPVSSVSAVSKARSEAQRKRWAAAKQKQRQREAAKKGTK